jgi:ribonuclease D
LSTKPLGTFTLVTAPSAVVAVCQRAARAGRVAIDTESNSFYAYFARLCLIQLTSSDDTVVLDPFALGPSGLEPLVALLADPRIEKVLHGADYDLRMLDRHLGARVTNLRDTQMAAQLLGEPQTGLAALAERELGVLLDKSHQRADWGHRPLSAEELAYAASDTASLLPLATRLEARLTELGRRDWWLEECGYLEQVRWEPPADDGLAFERVSGAGRLAGTPRDRFAALFGWREEEAASADVPPFRIMPNDALLALATTPPASLDELSKVKGVGRGVVRRAGTTLLTLLSAPPATPPRRISARPQPDKAREARVKKLRELRDGLATALGIDSAVLAPRAVLEDLAVRLPADRESFAAIVGREWRAALLESVFGATLQAWRTG